MMQAVAPERARQPSQVALAGFWHRCGTRIERMLEWLARYPPYPFESEYYFPPIEDRWEPRGKRANDGR